MKKWKACAQVNGDEYTSFTIFEFDVPDKLFDEVNDNVEY